LKSGSLSLLEPSGPLQACNGFALAFYVINSRKKVLREKAAGAEQVKKFPTFY
jgi:hypothetical protein